MIRSLTIGSNVWENTQGVMYWYDEQFTELIKLEIGSDNQLLLTMRVYDENGHHVAQLRRNAWAFNQDHYQIRTEPADLQLLTMAGDVVVAAHVEGTRTISISDGRFFAPDGTPIWIEANHLSIGTGTFTGMRFADGVGVVLRKGGLSIR